jgi:hypothetical protein
MKQKIFEWKSKQGELSKYLESLTQDYFVENVIITRFGIAWPIPAYFSKRALIICSDKKRERNEKQ